MIDQYVIDTEKAIVDFQTDKPLAAVSVAALNAAASAADHGEQAMPVHAEAVADEVDGNVTAKTATRPEMDALYRITEVDLLDSEGIRLDEVVCGQDVFLRMRFCTTSAMIPGKLSFVFNLYRHDDFYICGSTTVMDGIAPYEAGKSGEVVIKFPALPLLGGLYKWRVAINDHGGFIVHAEAKDVCNFRVVDDFNAVGLLNLQREWQSVHIEK